VKLPVADLLDPVPLAAGVGLLVVSAEAICALLESDIAKEILVNAKDSWSGGVYAAPLPTGELICIINPTHGRFRQKITLMEEISHIHLEHSPTGLRSVWNGLRLRDFNEKQEREAYGVGSAALLPWGAFFHDLNAGLPVTELAEKYQVSRELIEYRIKTSGGYKLYQARRRAA
jgi:Zn-dependent peptidase ImmA (M78 family)